MTVESAFSTTAPDALKVWEDWSAKREEFGRQLDAIEAEFGRRAYNSNSSFGLRFMGLEPTSEDRHGGTLPEGLRLDKKYHPYMLVPAKRTLRGKEIHAEWTKIRVRPPRFPGMPDSVFTEGAVYTPGFQKVEDTLWCTWGTSAERVTGEVDNSHRSQESQFDPKIWTPRRLSEYFAMREEQQAKSEEATA